MLILEGGVVLTGKPVTDASADRANQQPVINVVAQQLRQDLYNTKTLIATLNARLADTKNSLKVQNDRASRIPEIAATLADLNRDLGVNQTLYNDLLGRREYARVSMNVDKENQGLTLRVREPANYPTRTSGPRLIHFVITGLFLSVGVPLTAILARQHLDQKIRIGQKLESVDRALPVFVEIPHLATPKEARRMRFEYGLLASTLVMAVIGAGAVGILRMSSII
jgi:hypothetical protein